MSIDLRHTFNLKEFVKKNKKYFNQRKKKKFSGIAWTAFQVENVGNTSEGSIMQEVDKPLMHVENNSSNETKDEMIQNAAAESSQIDNIS